MSFAHDEEGAVGRTGRHMSVSNYASNLGAPTYDTSRRRSSIVPAAAVAAQQDETVFNQKDETLRKMSVAVPNLAELTADAKVSLLSNIMTAAQHRRPLKRTHEQY